VVTHPHSLTGALVLCALVGCVHQTDDEEAAQASESTETSEQPLPALPQPDAAPIRGQLDGHAFPDGVLALTWDDGPDAHTLALAEFLERERISATFFVVGEWIAGVSADPGLAGHVYDTGYVRRPILADLVSRGHRLGNHTLHHVLLGHTNTTSVDLELANNQRAIDPFIRDEMRLFRAPGGDWNVAASRALDGDGALAPVLGPIRWDVDAKDWEGSVSCDSQRPSLECEHADGRYRVRADVMAQRYEAAIASAHHGVVLLHDRVGDVGSEYALDVARLLVPRLVARGFVFAAPVLSFSPMRTRWNVATCAGLRLGDVDGDGRVDSCVRDHDRVTCATSSWRSDDHGAPHVAFDADYDELLLPPEATSFELADVNGDGHADVCVRTSTDIACAEHDVADAGWGPFRSWSPLQGIGSLALADIDGDGKADACESTPSGVVCARSTGAAFEPARVWLTSAPSEFALGDVNGDGRADICVRDRAGVECALGGRSSFGHLVRWSADTSFTGPITLADLNGDGRADLCGPTTNGVACALSNGHAFTASTDWSDDGTLHRAEWARFGDINGDGRSDICDCDGNGVRCALAP